MKRLLTVMQFILFLVAVQISQAAAASFESGANKSGSPYFFVNSDRPDVDRLPLKSTTVDIQIAGVIADVVVTQEYHNEGTSTIEAVYVFPASTRAAVHGMKMRIGERTIIAKIDERRAARRAYENARQNGQTASLLEQQRPNVFQMNVANILPEDVIEVELRYTELLVPDNAVYEFVYPTVVGPRYTGIQGDYQKPTENWTSNPYLHEKELPKNTLDINVNISAGMEISDISCDTHRTHIRFDGETEAGVYLDRSEKYGGNRDFIVNYRLAGGKIESGLLLTRGEKENYFLLMMQPPIHVERSVIPPREYMFIVDVSGSMHGFPLDTSKALLKNLINNLSVEDRFNVLLFAGGSSVMAEKSLPATKKNIQRAVHFIDRQRGGGGTQLLPAMKRALDMKGTEGYSRTIVIATDGYVSVEKETFDLIRNRLGDANMFAFGIGSSVNRYIIEGMARVGMGEPFIVTRPEEAEAKAEKLRALIEKPVLTNIEIDYRGFNTYDIEPISVPDVFANRPVLVFGKWRGRPKGKIRLSGISGSETYQKTIRVGTAKPENKNAALRYLWARHRIAMLSDYNKLSPNDERVKEVTNLGLTYNLLTDYTSFVAIDSQIRAEGGNTTTVKQPLPLPEGVSNQAVGGMAVSAGSHPRRMFAAKKASPAVPRSGEPLYLACDRVEESKEQFDMAKAEKEKRKADIKITVKTIFVPEDISEKTVRKLAQATAGKVDACLDQSIKKGLLAKNELHLKMTVDKNGRVTQIKIDNETVAQQKAIIQCLQKAFQQAVFPVGSGGSYEIRIIYTVSQN